MYACSATGPSIYTCNEWFSFIYVHAYITLYTMSSCLALCVCVFAAPHIAPVPPHCMTNSVAMVN